MTTDEVVRTLPARAGYRLADYAEVGLPVYRISSRIFTQVRKRVSAIDEFLLQLVRSGVHRTEEMSAFLGLPMPYVDGALSQLIADDLLSLNPNHDRTQRLSLSAKGKSAIEGAEILVPEEKTCTVEFNAIILKIVRYGRERLLTSRETRYRGYKQIRPLLKKQIGISDLPLRDVEMSFNGGSPKHDSRRAVLAICEIYKRHLLFLPAVCVIYRAVEGPDIQVSFVIDGVHSPEHDREFAQADGARLLHIDRDLLRHGDSRRYELIDQEIKEALIDAVSEAKANEGDENVKTHMRPVAEKESWSFLTAEQQVELQQSGVAYLYAQDHYPLLLHAIKTARYRLLILTPFLHEQIVTDEFVRDMERILRSGCKVYIGYGMPDSLVQKPTKSHVRVVERLEKLTRRYSNLIIRKVDSHAKVLLQDELFVVLGSFNWLSFRGDPDRAFRDEQSALIALPSMVEKKFQRESLLFT